MKRKIYRRMTGFCLIILMTLSLCACGKAAGENRNENESLAKEHVYKFREVKMPDFGGCEIDFILSVDRRYYDNEEISDIVDEELGGFFSGDRMAQETAEIIQRRAQIYVDTNMK